MAAQDRPRRGNDGGDGDDLVAAGGAAGTLAGGVITQALSWRWVLLINLPIGLVAAVVASAVVVDRRSDKRTSFDLAGALLLTVGLLLNAYGPVTAGSA